MDPKFLPRTSLDGVEGGTFGTTGGPVGAGAPGLWWLYWSDAGEGVAVAGLPGAAGVPRNDDIGGKEDAEVTAEPNIGCAVDSALGDMEGYA